LLAAFPILFLFAENLGETEPGEVVVPLALSVAAAGLAFAVLRVALHDAARAACLTSLGVAAFFLFGHAENLFASVGLTEGKVLAGWSVAAAVLAILILRTRRDLGRLTVALNVMTLVLVANVVVTIGVGLGSSSAAGPPAEATAPTPTAAPHPSRAATGQQRDIYYILVEDYGSPRTVVDTLGLPDTGQFEWLAEQGFHVLPETRSNYGRTPLSVASSLNMTYLDDIAARYGPDWRDYTPISDLVRNPAAARFLKDRGYKFVQIGSQFQLTSRSAIADVNPVFRDTSDFAGVLYDTTIVPAVVHRLGLDDGRSGRRKNYDAFSLGLELIGRAPRREKVAKQE
jgi:hypothetical protein